MKNMIFLALFAVFFAGCAIKSVDEAQKRELLAYTQKFEKDNFLVVATYLNPIYSQENDQNDDFIVSIYPQDAQILIESLKVNESDEGISAHVLNDDEPLLAKLAFSTPWAKYYKISVPAKDSQTLKLEFAATIPASSEQNLASTNPASESSQPHQVSLSFQKISKSLYWSPR